MDRVVTAEQALAVITDGVTQAVGKFELCVGSMCAPGSHWGKLAPSALRSVSWTTPSASG
jgi:hypothetical protein